MDREGNWVVKRLFFTILFLLLLIMGGVLFWQWNVYLEKQSAQSKHISYQVNETIHMEVKGRYIEVEHEFFGLPTGNYQLNFQKSIKPVCQEDDKSCQQSGNQKQNLETNGGTLRFTYKLKKSTSQAFVLDNWAVQLEQVKIENTRVEITDYSNKVGIWAAGARLIGETEKEKISYYVFEGREGTFPLYYQQKKSKQFEAGDVMVYGASSGRLVQAVQKYEAIAPITLIITTAASPFSSEHLLIGPSVDKLAHVLSKRYYQTYYPFSNKKERWLQSVIGAYVRDEKPKGKAKQLYEELAKGLTKEQQAAFVSVLKKKRGQEFSAEYLDELLSNVTGLVTHYFELNKVKSHKVHPLIFINQAKWLNRDGEHSVVQSVTVRLKRYYLLEQVTEKLGFHAEWVNQHFYLNNGSKTFRLYPGKKVFLYNEKAHSVEGTLLTQFNNQYYISEDYMLKVFNVFVREQNNELELVDLNTLQ